MSKTPESETLDRLYLEWSQFTKARTSREIALMAAIDEAINVIGIYAAFSGDPKISDVLNRCTAAFEKANGVHDA